MTKKIDPEEKFIQQLKKEFKDYQLFDKAVQLPKDVQKAGYERL